MAQNNENVEWQTCTDCKEIQIALCNLCGAPGHFASASRWYYKKNKGKLVVTCPSCMKRYDGQKQLEHLADFLCKHHHPQYVRNGVCMAVTMAAK